MERAGRFLIRAELRGEKRLYGLAALTTAFAAAALTLTLAIGDTFERSFAAASKTLLGGDIAVRLRQRNFRPEELQWMRENSRDFSLIRSAAALAVAGERSHMARLKIADNNYPLLGELVLKDGGENDLQTLLSSGADDDGVFPAAADASLLPLLGLSEGDTLTAAGLTLRIAHAVEQEPDPDERMWMTAPLILTGTEAGKRLQTAAGGGFLSSWHARALLAEGESAEAWEEKLAAAFPEAEWRVREAEQSMPGLRRFVGRMRDFLAVLSLAAMFAAGIGIGGAAAAFLRARVRAIAAIKMVGGGGRLIARVYLTMAALFVAAGAAAGTVVGGGLLFFLSPYLSSSLPLDLSPQWPWSAMAKALLVAVLVGAAFVILPVLRASRINPLTLFKSEDDEPPPLSRRDVLIGACVWITAFAAMPLAPREKLAALGVLAAAALVYFLSLLSARLIGKLSGALKTMPPPLAWGLSAIARYRRQTAAGVVSLAAGMALLIAILNMEGNFAARIDDTLRREAPALYFVGIGAEQEEALRTAVSDESPQARLRTIPFLRGRIHSIGGRPADSIDAPSDKRWILRGDRGLTWTADGGYIGASEVSDGALWDKNESRPQASFEGEAAEAFDMQLGDELVLNILGEKATVVVTSFREINWQSFDINFVVILDRPPFEDVPYSLMGAAFMPPDDEDAVKLAVARDFPNITPLSIGAVFDLAQRLLQNIALLLQAAAVFMLVGALPAVAAALMDGQRRRTRDAVALRLLGAPAGAIIAKGLTEFVAIAAAAAAPALIFGALAAKLTVENIFELDWEFNQGAPLLIVAAGFLLFAMVGTLNIANWIRHPPLLVIRND